MNKKIKKISIGLLLISGMSLVACSDKTSNLKVCPYELKELKNYVSVEKYKGIEVEKPKVDVTDDEVKSEIDAKLKQQSKTKELKEGIAKTGDRVKISYVGKLDGKAFEGGSTGDEGTVIQLGSSGYIKGFDDGVLGMRVGESKTLNLKFPKDYWKEDLASKDVTFDVKLIAKIIDEKIKYDMKFVSKNSKAKSIEEYEKNIKEEIKNKKVESSQMEIKQLVWKKIIDGSKVKKYPEGMIEEIKKENDDFNKKTAEQYGMSKDEFIKNYAGMDEKSYQKYLEDYSKSVAHQKLVMYYIAKSEKIDVTEEEYKTKLEEIKKSQGVTDEEAFKKKFGQSFEEYVGAKELKNMLLLEKVIDFVVKKSKDK